MSSNGNGYSKFSIAGLCISLIAPFLFGAGGLVYLGIVFSILLILFVIATGNMLAMAQGG